MPVSPVAIRAPRRPMPAPVVARTAPVAKAVAQAAPCPPAPQEGFFEQVGRWIDGLLHHDAPAPKPKPQSKPPTSQPEPPVKPAPAPQSDLPILTRDDSGELVLYVQKRLGQAGFPLSATPNGYFGPATEAAVRAFQQAKGLPVTGNVGPLTWAALGVKHNPLVPEGAPAIQAVAVADLLNAPEETFKRNWPYLARALKQAGMSDRATVIAVLATIHVETSDFEPIDEYGGPSYWAQYNGRTDLGNRPGTDDGVTYHGRGYIQLTGRANYIEYGRQLGIDLVNHPDLALRPDVAAKVLVAYFKDHGIAQLAQRGDWLGVRKAVNGGTTGWTAFSGAVTALQQHPELFGA